MKMELKKQEVRSFTLIELLVVIAVIGLLAGLLLAAAAGVRNQAARSQAKSEIAALEAALTRYQMDNGNFPPAMSPTPDQVVSPTNYISNSQVLFSNLMGRSSFNSAPSGGLKAYLDPKKTMVNTNSTLNYFTDPWGNSYGYHWNTNATPPTSMFSKAIPDLWSTAGQLGTGTQTNRAKWIANWIN